MVQTEHGLQAAPATIGVFDSGIGGLSVLREIRRELPSERLLYLADRGNHPYGSRPLHEVRDLSERITRFLIGQGAQMLVIACNTASAAALYYLRQRFPELPVVGMEPALKPAAEHTRSGKIGVLATAGTLRGEPYAGVVERFAKGVEIFEQSCPGLAEMVEHDHPAAVIRGKLEEWLAPMRAAGVDQLALACTHYPLVIDLIREVAGEGMTVIDPAPAIARQTRRRLAECGLLCDNHVPGGVLYFATGSTDSLSAALPRHTGQSGEVRLAMLVG